MKLLMRKTPRACMALTLILSLLGLGALEPSICRGSDGHSGLKTRLSACCWSGARGDLAARDSDRGRTTALDPVGGVSSCEDTPLVQRALTLTAQGPPVGCLGPLLPLPGTVAASPAGAPLFCPGSILGRLRSTTLLI
jgi:hypothetical protein